MKYIRTKDGRIVEECNLEPGLKQTRITLIRKRDNETLRQIICDDMDDYVEMLVVGEYCKCHKINPKDIKWEREILLNDILKQADTIEELFDAKVAIRKSNHKPYLGHFSGTLFFKEDTGWLGRVDSYEAIYGVIWIKGKHDEPILKPVAKMKGVLPNGEIDWELL